MGSWIGLFVFLKWTWRNELEATWPIRNFSHIKQERTSLFAELVFQNVRVIKKKKKICDLPLDQIPWVIWSFRESQVSAVHFCSASVWWHHQSVDKKDVETALLFVSHFSRSPQSVMTQTEQTLGLLSLCYIVREKQKSCLSLDSKEGGWAQAEVCWSFQSHPLTVLGNLGQVTSHLKK